MKTTYKKIVSQLSYSPSFLPLLNSHIEHYSRVKKLRLITLLLTALLIGLNAYLVLSPPQSSVATSDNDLIYGGLGGSERIAKKTLIQVWDNNQNPGGENEEDIREIFQHFGLTYDEITNAKETTLCSNCNNQDKKLKVLGRNTGLPIVINEAGIENTYYQQPLENLDSANSTKRHRALRLKKNTYVLYSSGNIVFIDESKPDVSVVISPINQQGQPQQDASNPGYYRVYVKNNGESTAHSAQLEIKLSENTELLKSFPEVDYESGNKIGYKWKKLSPGDTPYYFDIIVTSEDKMCLEAKVSALDMKQVSRLFCNSSEQQAVSTDNTKQAPPTSPELVPANELEFYISSRNLDGANPAEPLDRIEYTVDIYNKTLDDIEDYELDPLNLSDALEYSSVTKLNGAVVTGDNLQWPLLDIKSGEHVRKTFELKINDNLANTSQSSTNPMSYDCTISVSYGSTSSTPVNCGITKSVEQSVHTLPTITTTTLVICLSFFLLATGYYYIHNSYLVKELVTLQQHYARSHNGMNGG